MWPLGDSMKQGSEWVMQEAFLPGFPLTGRKAQHFPSFYFSSLFQTKKKKKAKQTEIIPTWKWAENPSLQAEKSSLQRSSLVPRAAYSLGVSNQSSEKQAYICTLGCHPIFGLSGTQNKVAKERSLLTLPVCTKQLLILFAFHPKSWQKEKPRCPQDTAYPEQKESGGTQLLICGSTDEWVEGSEMEPQSLEPRNFPRLWSLWIHCVFVFCFISFNAI